MSDRFPPESEKKNVQNPTSAFGPPRRETHEFLTRNLSERPGRRVKRKNIDTDGHCRDSTCVHPAEGLPRQNPVTPQKRRQIASLHQETLHVMWFWFKQAMPDRCSVCHTPSHTYITLINALCSVHTPSRLGLLSQR